ncbi:MAG TPA: LysR family transcriptional regulator [Stellaceae bacterium]|jgi:DNA-binding transcriptional LysR family regulator
MNRLPDFEAWAVFAKIIEAGSFAGAASELGLSKPTVSKAISRLESRLGERLFHRTSRRLSPTETGRALSLRAAQMLAEAEAIETDALAQSATPRGRIRMAAPMSFGLEYVAPALPEFLLAYPEISVDLHLSDQVADLVGGGFDLALRIAALSDSSMVARRLCPVERLLVGAPDYFAKHGRPSHPSELSGHACLGYSYSPSGDSLRFAGPAGEEYTVSLSGPLKANNAEALLPSVRAGLGIALQPEFVVWRDLRDGRLEAVMTGWSPPPIALNLVTPSGGPRPSKIKVAIEFLVRRFSEGSEPWRNSGHAMFAA